VCHYITIASTNILKGIFESMCYKDLALTSSEFLSLLTVLSSNREIMAYLLLSERTCFSDKPYLYHHSEVFFHIES